VAELLSQHYAEVASTHRNSMTVSSTPWPPKTGADLSNLLLDLPGPKPPCRCPLVDRDGQGSWAWAVLVLVVGVAASVSAWSCRTSLVVGRACRHLRLVAKANRAWPTSPKARDHHEPLTMLAIIVDPREAHDEA